MEARTVTAIEGVRRTNIPTQELPTFDLTHVMMRVRSRVRGLTDQQYADAEVGYREYMAYVKRNPTGKMQPPSQLIDEVWHTHIFLCTRQYAADCQAFFGYFLHHAAICDGGGCDHEGPPHRHLVGDKHTLQ